MPKTRDAERPWERQPGETEKAYEAFVAYRDLGAQRSVSAVSEKLSKSRQLETVKAEKESEVAEQEQRLSELAPAVKNMERLAADFSANPEQILPEAGALETGRSYREKKAKPLLARIVKVLRALYLAYVELKGKFERLQADYGQVQKANSRLSERLQEVKLENKSLRRNSADYAQLKQILGAEQIEATLNAAKQQKQEQKRSRRSFER